MRPLIVCSGAVLGLLACTSEEPPTGPSTGTRPELAAVKTYTAVDLGTLGGFSRANGINPAGQVVGFSYTQAGERHPFLWSKGVMTGTVRCTRLDGNFVKADTLGDLGCTCVEYVDQEHGFSFLLPRPIVRHSPTGFEWGYGGSGPADLAANILALVVPITEAWRLHHRFLPAVARLPRDGGEIDIEIARAWVQAEWDKEEADVEGMAKENALRADLAEIARLDVEAAIEEGL